MREKESEFKHIIKRIKLTFPYSYFKIALSCFFSDFSHFTPDELITACHVYPFIFKRVCLSPLLFVKVIDAGFFPWLIYKKVDVEVALVVTRWIVGFHQWVASYRGTIEIHTLKQRQMAVQSWCIAHAAVASEVLKNQYWATWLTPSDLAILSRQHNQLPDFYIDHIFPFEKQSRLSPDEWMAYAHISEAYAKRVALFKKHNHTLLEGNTLLLPFEKKRVCEQFPDNEIDERLPFKELPMLSVEKLMAYAEISEVYAERVLLSDEFDRLSTINFYQLRRRFPKMKQAIDAMTIPHVAIQYMTSIDEPPIYPFQNQAQAKYFYMRLVQQIGKRAESEGIDRTLFKKLLKLHPCCFSEIFHYPALLQHLRMMDFCSETSISDLKLMGENESQPEFYIEAFRRLLQTYDEGTAPLHYQLRSIRFPALFGNVPLEVKSDSLKKQTDAPQYYIEEYTEIDFAKHILNYTFSPTQKYPLLALEVLSVKKLVDAAFPQFYSEMETLNAPLEVLEVPPAQPTESLQEIMIRMEVSRQNIVLEETQKSKKTTHEVIYRGVLLPCISLITSAIEANHPEICMRIGELIQNSNRDLRFLPMNYHAHLNSPAYWFKKAISGEGFRAYLHRGHYLERCAEKKENTKENTQSLYRQARNSYVLAFRNIQDTALKNQASLALARLYEAEKIPLTEKEIAEKSELAQTPLNAKEVSAYFAVDWYQKLSERHAQNHVPQFVLTLMKEAYSENDFDEMIALYRYLPRDLLLTSKEEHFDAYSLFVCFADVIVQKATAKPLKAHEIYRTREMLIDVIERYKMHKNICETNHASRGDEPLNQTLGDEQKMGSAAANWLKKTASPMPEETTVPAADVVRHVSQKTMNRPCDTQTLHYYQELQAQFLNNVQFKKNQAQLYRQLKLRCTF